MVDQPNLFDALAALDPTVTTTMEAEPGWAWARCPVCQEIRYLRRKDLGSRCILTGACGGRLEAYLVVNCATCGKPVTRARTRRDTRYCSKKCEEG